MLSSPISRASAPRVHQAPSPNLPERRRGWYEDGHLKAALVEDYRRSGGLLLRGFVPAPELRGFLEELAPTGQLGDAAASGTLTLYGFASQPRFRELFACLLGQDCVMSRRPTLLAPAEAGPELVGGARVHVSLTNTEKMGAGDVALSTRPLVTGAGFRLTFDVRTAHVSRAAPSPLPSAVRAVSTPPVAPAGRRRSADAQRDSEHAR